jgi:hypothetical protein
MNEVKIEAQFQENRAVCSRSVYRACRRPRRISAPALTLRLWLSISIWRLRRRRREFSIAATGRDQERCSRLDDNLILEAYKEPAARATGGR